MKLTGKLIVLSLMTTTFVVSSCDDDDNTINENTGSTCDTPDECYPDANQELIEGEVICMDRVEDGYCTHYCNTDADCCAVDGECSSDFPQVCAPFENSNKKRCFLSCDGVEEEDFCMIHAHESFSCRSTGGGTENRKVCMPN